MHGKCSGSRGEGEGEGVGPPRCVLHDAVKVFMSVKKHWGRVLWTAN